MKIICFTNETDTEELKKFNKSNLELEFIESLENLPDSKFYIISLKKASEKYKKFVGFMRSKANSKFIFLNENGFLSDDDFAIRDEKNTEPYMWVSSAALTHIRELIDQANI